MTMKIALLQSMEIEVIEEVDSAGETTASSLEYFRAGTEMEVEEQPGDGDLSRFELKNGNIIEIPMDSYETIEE